MTENGENKVKPVRVSPWLSRQLDIEQNRMHNETGVRPSKGDILEKTWREKRGTLAVVPTKELDRDVKFLSEYPQGVRKLLKVVIEVMEHGSKALREMLKAKLELIDDIYADEQKDQSIRSHAELPGADLPEGDRDPGSPATGDSNDVDGVQRPNRGDK